MFPFASHAKYGYNLDFADKELKEAGALARKYGHRLTLHPGQVSGFSASIRGTLNILSVHSAGFAEACGRPGISAGAGLPVRGTGPDGS